MMIEGMGFTVEGISMVGSSIGSICGGVEWGARRAGWGRT